jgi:hypothetical protein
MATEEFKCLLGNWIIEIVDVLRTHANFSASSVHVAPMVRRVSTAMQPETTICRERASIPLGKRDLLHVATPLPPVL